MQPDECLDSLEQLGLRCWDRDILKIVFTGHTHNTQYRRCHVANAERERDFQYKSLPRPPPRESASRRLGQCCDGGILHAKDMERTNES
ncbi:hypothetical protein VFPPC_15576 [Pochonia chlamydosporia 170]|uniref:Uncharacterized protein n=1 Tax=Pochonia chlamydosporia 170 TaxID=1380566 RepID=A0A179FXM6_METCM|nr:hypothetical protein VFPPC_15576 [Pochonia chlamydosporia 170]OAQ70436.1 hypothetical protein VFPPC_15576 [Pochonia chlamydosporia 170]